MMVIVKLQVGFSTALVDFPRIQTSYLEIAALRVNITQSKWKLTWLFFRHNEKIHVKFEKVPKQPP